MREALFELRQAAAGLVGDEIEFEKGRERPPQQMIEVQPIAALFALRVKVRLIVNASKRRALEASVVCGTIVSLTAFDVAEEDRRPRPFGEDHLREKRAVPRRSRRSDGSARCVEIGQKGRLRRHIGVAAPTSA